MMTQNPPLSCFGAGFFALGGDFTGDLTEDFFATPPLGAMAFSFGVVARAETRAETRAGDLAGVFLVGVFLGAALGVVAFFAGVTAFLEGVFAGVAAFFAGDFAGVAAFLAGVTAFLEGVLAGSSPPWRGTWAPRRSSRGTYRSGPCCCAPSAQT